jgi:hypothetical protein
MLWNLSFEFHKPLEAVYMLRRNRFFSLMIVFAMLVLTLIIVNKRGTVPASASAGKTSIIVELRDDPAAVYKVRSEKAGATVSQDQVQAYRDQLRAKQDQFLNALSTSGINFEVVSRSIKNYDGSIAATVPMRYTLVFNGFALQVSPSAIDAIKSLPQVKSVHADSRLYPSLNHSVDYIRAPQVYGNYQELTQFDNMNEGFEGQGMYVSIIDTGVDWTHPMFGGDPTPPRLGVAPPTPAVTSTNKKVVYYLPLTDVAVNDGFGHGTHVGSTVAGYLAQAPGPDGLPNTADDIRLHGVAPQAKLMSYKVCSDVFSSVYALGGPPLGGCESSNTIMALEDSVSPFSLTGQPKPVANAINMSLGGGGGPFEPTAIAASNAALAGAVVVAASGNSGPGEGTTGSPAAGIHVISVGATTHPGSAGSSWSSDLLQANSIPATTTGAVTPAKNFSAAAGNTRLKLFAMSGTTGLPAGAMAQRYVFINDPLVVWPTSVAGRIALVKSAIGGTIFDIVAQANNAGAVGVILSDDRGTVNGVKTQIPAATIAPADFEILVDALSSTDNNAVDPANGAISELPVRMNPTFSDTFVGEMADFSSRGPVEGLGQVKPDVSAPGVQVLAAVPPASLIGALAAVGSPTAPNYYYLDGTSMATPHVAGAVTLVKQAHLNWTPDMIRAAFINTSTNGRDQAGAPKADGAGADSIIAQGSGFIDVKAAMDAKALMGVAGDGIDQPGILASHSYGDVPVINSRVTHTETVGVNIQDLSGQGGSYSLRVANNRELQRNGVSVSLSSANVSVPAGGTASYNVNVAIDGNIIRDTATPIEFQWYVIAERAGQTLRMPFYLNASRTLPESPRVTVEPITDTMLGMDAGNTLASGVTYKDYPMNLGSDVLTLEGTLDFLVVANTPGATVNDLDFYLYGPDDPTFANPIAVSGVPGGPEHIKVAISKPGTYTWRVVGYANAPATDYTLTTTKTLGSQAPALQTINGEFTNAQGKPVDFDGNFNLSWAGNGGETGFEVERSTDGTNYETIANLAGNQTSLALTNQPNGEINFRVRALTPGKIGSYETGPSNVTNIIVDRRGKVDITSVVSTAMSNVNLTGGVFTLDLNVTNNSTSAYVPFVELNVVKITSGSGTVSVKNADNSGNGKSTATAALFGYSDKLGADQVFSPAEVTGTRTLQFNDGASEMFSFDLNITAYLSTSGGGGGGGAAAPAGAGANGGSSSAGNSLLPLTKVMRVTVNPLTKQVSTKLL